MSFWAKAMMAAQTAVSPPTNATTNIAAGLSTKMLAVRHTKYTPAVTMVAAWIRALTGVGPAMASGSQTYSGSWALLPAQPRNRNSPTSVAALAVRGLFSQVAQVSGSTLASGTW